MRQCQNLSTAQRGLDPGSSRSVSCTAQTILCQLACAEKSSINTGLRLAKLCTATPRPIDGGLFPRQRLRPVAWSGTFGSGRGAVMGTTRRVTRRARTLGSASCAAAPSTAVPTTRAAPNAACGSTRPRLHLRRFSRGVASLPLFPSSGLWVCSQALWLSGSGGCTGEPSPPARRARFFTPSGRSCAEVSVWQLPEQPRTRVTSAGPNCLPAPASPGSDAAMPEFIHSPERVESGSSRSVSCTAQTILCQLACAEKSSINTGLRLAKLCTATPRPRPKIRSLRPSFSKRLRPDRA